MWMARRAVGRKCAIELIDASITLFFAGRAAEAVARPAELSYRNWTRKSESISATLEILPFTTMGMALDGSRWARVTQTYDTAS